MTPLQIKPYVQRLKTPYHWAKGVHHVRRGLLFRVDLDGHIGWGEAALPPHLAYEGWAFASQCHALLYGLDIRQKDFVEQIEDREVAPRIRCGVVSALLSAQASATAQPLAKLLTTQDHSPARRVSVNDLIGDPLPENCVVQAQTAVNREQNTVKIKCTVDRTLDLARVRAVREAFPALRIRLDPNESWQTDWALDQIRAMAPFDIDYIEEPLPHGTDLTTYARLVKQSPIPIALDDYVLSVFHARRAIEMQAANVLILKPQRLGGPDHVAAVIRLAHDAAIRCVVTTSLETAVGLHVALHCSALLPEPAAACGLGTARFFENDVAASPTIEAGWMRVPQSPGLGVNPQAWWDRQ